MHGYFSHGHTSSLEIALLQGFQIPTSAFLPQKSSAWDSEGRLPQLPSPTPLPGVHLGSGFFISWKKSRDPPLGLCIVIIPAFFGTLLYHLRLFLSTDSFHFPNKHAWVLLVLKRIKQN